MAPLNIRISDFIYIVSNCTFYILGVTRQSFVRPGWPASCSPQASRTAILSDGDNAPYMNSGVNGGCRACTIMQIATSALSFIF